MRPLASAVELDCAGLGARRLYPFLCGAVAPRPIAWVTTANGSGLVNAAPFSWFNAVCSDPPMVMLAVADHRGGRPKDTTRNIRDTGEFVVNAATRPLAQAMVQSSADYPSEVSEPAQLGLALAPSVRVKPPRLAASPIHLECRLDRILPLGRDGGDKTNLILGEVVHIAADDAVLDAEGNPDPARFDLVSRMGGSWYTDTRDHFVMERPRLPH